MNLTAALIRRDISAVWYLMCTATSSKEEFLCIPALQTKPKGKLRLLYECNPFAYIVEVAGGKATDGMQHILEKIPGELHERTPFFIGSIKMMEELEECLGVKVPGY